jgi:Na+-translocating ferredoxin:NAD+ oxidoreductase RnfG subunit
MWPSVTSSDRGWLPTLTALAGVWLATATAVPAQTLITQEEALRLAFPEPARIERRTAYLSEAEKEKARALAGAEVRLNQSIVTFYVASRDGEVLGAAYFDAHRVRTLAEVLMIVVTPEAGIARIEVLRFAEPPEYMAPDGWLAQFEERPLDPGLSLKGEIVNMTGATLTSRAVTRAARRVLALHQVIQPLNRQPVKAGA